MRLPHHLAHEEPEHALLASAVRLDLLRMGGDDRVDDRGQRLISDARYNESRTTKLITCLWCRTGIDSRS